MEKRKTILHKLFDNHCFATWPNSRYFASQCLTDKRQCLIVLLGPKEIYKPFQKKIYFRIMQVTDVG